jgi:hypothetical protein
VKYTVVLRLDPAGTCPVLLTDDSDPLLGEDDVRYRLVAEEIDFEEAARLARIIHEK